MVCKEEAEHGRQARPWQRTLKLSPPG